MTGLSLSMMLLALASGSSEASGQTNADAKTPPIYLSSVGFAGGRCQYFTGDVALNAVEYRDHLKESFDTHGSMIIFHWQDTPRRCVDKAEAMARQAGFHKVHARVGQVDLSPPR
jgi:hypothetical protein